MNGYSAKKVFDEPEQMLLKGVSDLIQALPDDDSLRCHELARAVGKFFKLEVIDGHYGLVEHSWCMTPDRKFLDCYAIGSLPQVQIVSPHVPGISTYKRGSPRSDINEEKVKELLLFFTKGLPTSVRQERCPSCGGPVRVKGLTEGGGVACTKCSWWFCY